MSLSHLHGSVICADGGAMGSSRHADHRLPPLPPHGRRRRPGDHPHRLECRRPGARAARSDGQRPAAARRGPRRRVRRRPARGALARRRPRHRRPLRPDRGAGGAAAHPRLAPAPRSPAPRPRAPTWRQTPPPPRRGLMPPGMPSDGHTESLPPQWQVWSALGAVYVIWGSTYLAIRVMVEDVPPLLGAAVRFLVAGTAMLAVLAARGRRVRVPGRALAAAALIGVLMPAGGNGVVTVAERHVPSGLAALLVASVPLWVGILRFTVARERVARATLAGLALGFVGLAVLLLPGSRPADATVGGIVPVLIAAGSWATGSFLSPRLSMPSDPLVPPAGQM